jgi:hypothetical protein
MTTEDETNIIRKQSPSSIAGVSVRGWVSLIIVGTYCVAVLVMVFGYTYGKAISPEVMLGAVGGIKELGIIVVAFYFGQQAERFLGKGKSQQPPPAS